MQNQVVLTTEPPGSFEKGPPLHRKVNEAIAKRDPRRAETYSRRLVNMPYTDLNNWLHPADRDLLT
jgi:DNA-binding FadR family transcriptional regulator